MKILAFADLHEHTPYFEKLKEKAKNVDLILCAGDMTIFENDLIGIIKGIASLKKETYIIHGNHETASHVKNECKKYNNLHFCHKRVFKKEGFSIFGYGGGGFSYKDEVFEEFIKKNMKHLQEKNILMTHQPPYQTNIDDNGMEHVGSKSIRKVIKQFDLVLSGHIHESNGKKQQIGKTLIMNPGPDGKVLYF